MSAPSPSRALKQGGALGARPLELKIKPTPKQTTDSEGLPSATGFDTAYVLTETETVGATGRTRTTKTSKSSFRIASINEGAFAFKSVHDLKQKEQPLKFAEVNLRLKLLHQELTQQELSKASKSGYNKLQLALRAKILSEVGEKRK